MKCSMGNSPMLHDTSKSVSFFRYNAPWNAAWVTHQFCIIAWCQPVRSAWCMKKMHFVYQNKCMRFSPDSERYHVGSIPYTTRLYALTTPCDSMLSNWLILYSDSPRLITILWAMVPAVCTAFPTKRSYVCIMKLTVNTAWNWTKYHYLAKNREWTCILLNCIIKSKKGIVVITPTSPYPPEEVLIVMNDTKRTWTEYNIFTPSKSVK